MSCPKCGSIKTAQVSTKRENVQDFRVDHIPDLSGLEDDEYYDFSYCLSCGHIDGEDIPAGNTVTSKDKPQRNQASIDEQIRQCEAFWEKHYSAWLENAFNEEAFAAHAEGVQGQKKYLQAHYILSRLAEKYHETRPHAASAYLAKLFERRYHKEWFKIMENAAPRHMFAVQGGLDYLDREARKRVNGEN